MNRNNIIKLKEKIEKELTPIIDSDYVLIDVPDYDNIGDNLIWEGELDFLKTIPFKKKYESSLFFFQQNKIPKDTIILMQGGGNFGDIYPVVNNFRLEVIKNNLDKKIIILPQTIHYNDKKNLEKDAKIINLHKNLTICVRDKVSYEIAKNTFKFAKILLLPDMAFCINVEKFRANPNSGKKTLIMDRKDGEKTPINLVDIEQYDVLDWPTFNTTKEERFKKLQFNRRIDKIAIFLQKIPLLSNLVDPRYGLKSTSNKETYIQLGLEFFNQYDTIYTTRLHGLILGILMGKNMKILDNSYGKLTSFTEMWLEDFDGIEVIKTAKS